MGVEAEIIALAKTYATNLDKKVSERMLEMEEDGNDHYLIYKALGVSEKEGKQIDLFQNKGRFLYKYVGSFMEQATILCLKNKFSSASTVKVKNNLGSRPKTFEIDCLVNDQDAFEIKWRDATTDGDHINKEHTRLRVIASYGYKPIRLMFFSPLRGQAIKIQKKLRSIYEDEGGRFYEAQEAWNFIHQYTDTNLKLIVTKLATEIFDG